MAFKILNNEELSLLNDDERMQYEEELDLYQKRVAFVEKIEMLENVYIEPYKPKLEPISVISEAEVKPFQKTEYTISIHEPVEKPSLQVLLKKPEKVKAILPLMPKRAEISEGYIKKIEKVKPTLPLVLRPAEISEKHIKKIEKVEPSLPLTISPQILIGTFKWSRKNPSKLPTVISLSKKWIIPFEKMKNNLQHTPENIPDVVKPDININNVNVSVQVKPDLPQVSACRNEEITFIKPEKQSINLPVIEKSDINITYKKQNGESEPDLPNVFVEVPMFKEFHKPKQQSSELPTIEKPSAEVPSFEMNTHDIQILPELSAVELDIKKFDKPESKKINLPGVSNIQVDIAPVKKPKRKKYNVPVVEKMNVVVSDFKKPEKVHPDMITVPKPSITVKKVEKQKKNVSDLPVINIAEAPDAYSELKEFFFMSSENAKDAKG